MLVAYGPFTIVNIYISVQSVLKGDGGQYSTPLHRVALRIELLWN